MSTTTLADRFARHEQRINALTSGSRDWFRIENAAGGRVKVYLYEPIGGFFGRRPKEFVDEINEVDASEIELHINSPGGSVYDGIAIMNALRQHKARVVAVVDGLAASAASFIAVGGADEVVMAENSELMIHDAWGLAIGAAADMRRMGEDLDRVSDNIASIYTRKAGGTIAKWREVMLEETWYSAQAAVDAGLADRVGTEDDEDTDAAAAAASRWDLAALALADTNHPSPSGGGSIAPAAAASGDTTQGGALMNEEQMKRLRQAIGVADDADADTCLTALTEALEEQSSQNASHQEPPEGMRLIESATLESLQADASAGREARKQQQDERRSQLVRAAVRDGKVSPARAEAWKQRLAADPEEETTLANLAPGLVPVDEEGHAGEGDQSADPADALYDAVFGTTATSTKES